MISLPAQAEAGGDAELTALRKLDVSAEGVELVGALLAPRQADRLSIKQARKHRWFSVTS